jgi:hypothetical protein
VGNLARSSTLSIDCDTSDTDANDEQIAHLSLFFFGFNFESCIRGLLFGLPKVCIGYRSGMDGVPIVLYLMQPGQCHIAGRAICAVLAGRTEKGAVLESRLQAPAVVTGTSRVPRSGHE